MIVITWCEEHKSGFQGDELACDVHAIIEAAHLTPTRCRLVQMILTPVAE